MAEMRGRAGEAGRFLKSLGNEHRLLILCSLAEGEKSVGELERLLEMRQPHLSQHLTRLRADGLVMTRRVSRTVYYRLGSEPAERLIGLLYELFCARDVAPALATDGTPPADGTTTDA
ncbi:metalloregulator ArsR/SmtB family transcription factor [Paeniroseomonas aquatica]|uniref:Metalloregulator ArsR/SmtB family transcription factor n=1 Tax=Paeniroseomonas aquatica TaxID=373043 RepID=A0ABT8A1A3_9PROT|nr:metalloregulator ArsR/SmtB family transcription factor [Paeniroseomonas aquatica]MDN3563512.1 metalloregulator ArsR/SmtB family transcription factor [Paeniroseomonas aquatica]